MPGHRGGFMAAGQRLCFLMYAGADIRRDRRIRSSPSGSGSVSVLQRMGERAGTNMREVFSVIFLILALALAVCAVIALRSEKSMGRPVALLLVALIPPVIGNMIIIFSGQEKLSLIGCYIYFLGMDLVMAALLRFTFAYCRISWPHPLLKWAVCLLLAADVVQYALNPFFHHAFTTRKVMIDGFPYYKLVPLIGQTYHRVVDYGIFIAVLIIFVVKTARTPRIYAERYAVILLAMIFGGLWQSYYIVSGTPVDKSMIGFAIFGILVFYFALYYRPMRLLDRMLAGIASDMPEALFFYDATGRCIWANRPGMALTAMKGSDFEEAAENLERIFGSLGGGEEWFSERVLGSGEDARYYILEKHTVTDTHRGTAGSFLSVRDNTREQRARLKEKYSAVHDELTGLYRREYLYESIRHRIDGRPGERWLIIYVNVRNFKIVNDIFSSAFGDYTLRCIADWLRSRATANCLYGRLSGDNFGVCMPAEEFDEDRIREDLSRFTVRDGIIEHHVHMNLGVFEVTERMMNVSVMFDRAHMALSAIRDDYQTYIAWYDDEMRRKLLWDQKISSQLPDAIAARQVVPYLHPIVDRNGKVAGAEALVRWIHPEHGFLSPAEFIPVFEKNGMIAQVDRYMWKCACETLAGWGPEYKDLFISVNISPKDFYFMNVEEQIRKLVRDCGIDPARLRLEITETVMMTDMDSRLKILENLREAGFIVEMDDFGSGYSSLNMLKDMPVDVLKLDMAFLNKARDDEKAHTILRSIISLSGDLGIESLAEGVETVEQYRMLADMGCSLFQGYYFAKPMPLPDFEAFCRAQR